MSPRLVSIPARFEFIGYLLDILIEENIEELFFSCTIVLFC